MKETTVINETTEENNYLSLRTVSSTPYILDGVINKLYVLLEVQAKEQEKEDDTPRNPLELSIVLDRSGSMDGEKLDQSKEALKQLITNLHDDDTVHLVQYDDQVQQVFKDGNLKHRDQLSKKITAIDSGGSTNLMGGVLKGYELIDTKQSNTKTKRIFLFSDGLVNVGVTEPAQIYNNIRNMRKQGANVSAFGIGSDFDEDLMTAIAEVGGGDYFFIEGADTIPNVVAEGLGGLLEIVTQNTQLRVRGKNGATVTKVYGNDLMDAIDLGDVKSAEKRQFLVEVEIKAGAVVDPVEFLDINLTYNPVEDLTSTQSLVGVFSITKTTDEEKIVDENEEVMVVRSLLETADKEAEILGYLEQREFDKALDMTNILETDLSELLKQVDNEEMQQRITDKMDLIKTSKKRTERAKESRSTQDYLSSVKMSKYSSYQTRSSRKRKLYSQDDDEE